MITLTNIETYLIMTWCTMIKLMFGVVGVVTVAGVASVLGVVYVVAVAGVVSVVAVVCVMYSRPQVTELPLELTQLSSLPVNIVI